MSSSGRVDHRPAVVVLNMHYTGLGVARALRGTNTPVWGLSFDNTFIGESSRHCHAVRYPDPARDPHAALEFFAEFARRFERPPLLLATRDLDLEFLLKHRAEIESRYLLPLAPSPVMERILDKSRLVAAAQSIGVPCPREVRVTDPADLARAREQIQLPCVVKPVVASRWRQGQIHEVVRRRKVAVFNHWEDLTAFYGQIVGLDPEILVQEYVPGGDEELLIFGSYLNSDSGLLRYFTARKILQSPPESGTGIVVEAIPIPDIVDTSISLLKTLAYTGISEIEYKRDPRTGQRVLIEINPRHWDQHALGIAVGVNLTRALYDDITGENVAPMPQNPRPVSWIAEAGYLIDLQDAIRGTGYPLRKYLRPLLGRKTWATVAWDDPLPTIRLVRRVLGEYARAFGTLVGRLFTQATRRTT